jgi:hypothetical protein
MGNYGQREVTGTYSSRTRQTLGRRYWRLGYPPVQRHEAASVEIDVSDIFSEHYSPTRFVLWTVLEDPHHAVVLPELGVHVSPVREKTVHRKGGSIAQRLPSVL